MKQLKNYILLRSLILPLTSLFMVVAMVSCDNKDPDNTEPNPDYNIEVEITTRAYESNVIGELTFTNLWLLVYNHDGFTSELEYCANLMEDGRTTDLGDVTRVTRMLTNDIKPGTKSFYAIGNVMDLGLSSTEADRDWIQHLIQANKDLAAKKTSTLTEAKLTTFRWTTIPRLVTNPDGTYRRINKYDDKDHNPNGKYFQVTNMPMSGYAKDVVIKERIYNRVYIPVLRAVGKLEFELLPNWQDEWEGNPAPTSITLSGLEIQIQNQATESMLFEMVESNNTVKDPVDAYSIGINNTMQPAIVANPYHNDDTDYLTLIKTPVAPATKQKTIETVPMYFFENHPKITFDTEGRITGWADGRPTDPPYITTRYPHFVVSSETVIPGESNVPYQDSPIPIYGKHEFEPGRFKILPEDDEATKNKKTYENVWGIMRNHYYQITLNVELKEQKNGLFLILSVRDWTEVPELPTNPVESPN
ncbi:hypothetical protein [Bacteroides sp. 519]|uniref:hypothetical protein n=1 Tax=Bacteroides sp. 519 TaxID=2302937 RepID=UPI0013D46DEA|nr:hypothetical protein [Bacteroides sp. 519]NDV59559.1 hypothetical protein [Bacteroides sp. 519]